MRTNVLPALVLAFFGALLSGQNPPSSASKPGVQAGGAEREIRTVLDTQTAAWNQGDLKGFMAGYWNSPELTFYSGAAVTSGWQATLERYQKRYQAPGTEMGKLDFSQLEIHPDGDMAWVGGRWHLKMSDGKDLGGMFTLVFRKFPDGWKIVHDHTC
jgi:beta-aspartyl-peptidase (threonine type)